MAKSGSFNKVTSVIPARSLTFEWEITEQSAEYNTSTVKWKLTASLNSGLDDNTVTIGVTFDGASQGATSSSRTLSGTSEITHNADGTKTVNVRVYLNASGTAVNESGTGTMNLDAIDSRSTLIAEKGVLGEEQNLEINMLSSQTLHTVTYLCGSSAGTICENSEETYLTFTPPVELAIHNTTGTTVSITYTVETFRNGESAGITQATVIYTIPESVAPSCEISIAEATNYAATYGGYLQGLSKLSIQITPTTAYNSDIVSYRTNCDDVAYVGNDFTTEVIKNSGAITVLSTVTDGRGRSGSASKDVSFVPYSKPRVYDFTVHRCTADGSEDDQGAYVKVTFSASITSLSNKNTAAYELKYKKTSDSEYTVINLTAYNNVYAINGAEYIFLAEDSSPYNVVITATDDFYSLKFATSASTAHTILHFGADGESVGIGKLAEKSGVLDIGYITRHYGGFEYRILEDSSDADNMTTPNIYAISAANTYINMPVSGVDAIFEVIASANIQIQQFTVISNGAAKIYERVCVAETWTNWLSADAGGITKADIEAVLTGNITTHTHSQYITDVSGKLDKSGGALSGAVTAHTGTDYTTYRVRNIALKTAAETPANGAILGVYEA